MLGSPLFLSRSSSRALVRSFALFPSSFHRSFRASFHHFALFHWLHCFLVIAVQCSPIPTPCRPHQRRHGLCDGHFFIRRPLDPSLLLPSLPFPSLVPFVILSLCSPRSSFLPFAPSCSSSFVILSRNPPPPLSRFAVGLSLLSRPRSSSAFERSLTFLISGPRSQSLLSVRETQCVAFVTSGLFYLPVCVCDLCSVNQSRTSI